jgi:hypothetical protein
VTKKPTVPHTVGFFLEGSNLPYLNLLYVLEYFYTL